MSSRTLFSAAGALLLIAALSVSSLQIIEFLRTLPPDPVFLGQLLVGATLFRIGIAVLGLIVIYLGRSAVERQVHQDDQKPDLKWIWLLLLIALALRAYELDAGLWHDEILTYVRYVHVPAGETVTTFNDQNQHFLYTLLAQGSIRLFGDSNWTLRLPAVLFGVGSILTLYLFGCLVSNRREAFLSSTLLTFSYHHIWFSQNARGYTGLLFWTLLTSWLFLRAQRESTRRLWLFYAVTMALAVYTNMTILFIAVCHFLLFLPAASRNKWTGFLTGFCLAAFLTVLLYSLVLPQLFGRGVSEVSTVPEWKQPFWTILEFVRALRTGFAGNIVAVMALAVFAAGFVSYVRTNWNMAVLFAVPIVLCFAIVVGMGHHLWPRFFFFAFGFAALIAVRGTMILGAAVSKLLKLHRPELTGTVLCAGMIVVSAAAIPRVYSPKQDFGEALRFVESQKEPGDVIVTAGLATIPYQEYYKRNWPEVKTADALNSIRSKAKHTWILYTFPPEVQSVYPDVMAVIRNDFRVVKEFHGTVGSGTIYVCRSMK